MDKEIELILTKLKLVSEIEESGAYVCDKEHSKTLLDYITNLQKERNMFKNSFETMSKNYFEEKAKNEKVIKYIKETIKNNEEWDEYRENNLLNILQGSDKE